MINYGEIILKLGAEISTCYYHCNGMIPAYYEQELCEAVDAVTKCSDSLKGLCKSRGNDAPHDPYKVEQLLKMLSHETSQTEEHYGARLRHGGGDTKVLTIDAGGLRALIAHYATHRTDLENGGEEGEACTE